MQARTWWRLTVLALLAAWAADAHAQLQFSVEQRANGERFIIVSGEFRYEDRLNTLESVLKRARPSFIGFDSPGGNVLKAMELGRLIRSLQISTRQTKSAECASACALAFLGGVRRFAEPRAIGVHQSSFENVQAMDSQVAVSAIQQLTAEVITYMIEMGADPALLQLALKYEKDDIRYLSASEMRDFRVTSAAEDLSFPNYGQAGPAPAAVAPVDAALRRDVTEEAAEGLPEPRGLDALARALRALLLMWP